MVPPYKLLSLLTASHLITFQVTFSSEQMRLKAFLANVWAVNYAVVMKNTKNAETNVVAAVILKK